MASPVIGEVAMWTAIKAFVVAASVGSSTPSGIPAAKVYRAQQNSTEFRGTPASARLWADTGVAALAVSWQGQRTKLLEQWLLRVVTASEGSIYAGTVLDTPFSYTAQPGDGVEEIRDGLLAALPAEVDAAAAGVDALSITAQTAGVPLAAEVDDDELLELVRTRKTAAELRWCPGEITVQIEVVVERPRDDPDSVPSAVAYLDAILGKLAHPIGPHADLVAAGVGYRRVAMQVTDMTALDRVVTRSRARMDLVFSVDVGDTLEFDLVAGFEATGEVQV
jgi:hypothetical protein